MTAVALSDILDFGLGFEVVVLALGVVALLTSLLFRTHCGSTAVLVCH